MNYFKNSDQILTYADLNTEKIEEIDKISSMGFLLQKMPGGSDSYLNYLYQSILQSHVWNGIKENVLDFNLDNIKLIFQELSMDIEYQVSHFLFLNISFIVFFLFLEISC